jgi:hypothetical protein
MKYNKTQLIDQLADIIANSTDYVVSDHTFKLPKYGITIWIANVPPFDICFYSCELSKFPLSLVEKIKIWDAVKQAMVNKLGDILTKG